MRQAIEALAVYTHIWQDPFKAVFVSDADTDEYCRAFRLGPNKEAKRICKMKGIKYKFAACKFDVLWSRLYKLSLQQLRAYCVIGCDQCKSDSQAEEPVHKSLLTSTSQIQDLKREEVF
jgi:hypothetical protein